MNCGVAVNLAGRGLKDGASQPFGEPQHVDGTVHRSFRRGHRIMLVMHGRGRTGEVINFIDLNIERKSNIVAQKLKAVVLVKMFDIAFRPRKQIVHAKNIMALIEKMVDQMRPNKSRTSGDKNSFAAFF